RRRNAACDPPWRPSAVRRKGKKREKGQKRGQVHFPDADAGLPRGRTSTLRPMRASILLRKNGGRTGPGVVESDAPSAGRRGRWAGRVEAKRRVLASTIGRAS